MKTHHKPPTPKARKEQLTREETQAQMREVSAGDDEMDYSPVEQESEPPEGTPHPIATQRPYSRPQPKGINPSLDDLTAMKGLAVKARK